MNKVDSFEEGNITVCQDFMNLETMKYNKIISSSDGFKSSVHTVHEDIVALLAIKKRPFTRTKPAETKRKHNDDNDSSKPKKLSSPDFITHYKDSSDIKYKVGDKKFFNNQTFYFYDAPTHREKLKWHTHQVDDCRARKK